MTTQGNENDSKLHQDDVRVWYAKAQVPRDGYMVLPPLFTKEIEEQPYLQEEDGVMYMFLRDECWKYDMTVHQWVLSEEMTHRLLEVVEDQTLHTFEQELGE